MKQLITTKEFQKTKSEVWTIMDSMLKIAINIIEDIGDGWNFNQKPPKIKTAENILKPKRELMADGNRLIGGGMIGC